MLALAGCSGGEGDETDPTPTPTPTPTAEPTDFCPTVTSSTLVPGWTKQGGDWGPAVNMQGEVESVCGEATQPLSILLSPAGSFGAVVANVSFAMLGDDIGGGSGAGLVINYKDADNYVIVRYSPREQGWHLFTMTGGEREKRDEASVTPPTTNPEYREWVNLTVRHEAGHVTAFDGTTKVIDYMLPAGSSLSGQVGYFLRDTGMAALFDDFTANAP